MPSVRRNATAMFGWVGSAALTQAPEATHWVIAPATHLYPRPDVKAQAEVALFFGSAVNVTVERQGFHRIQTGHFVPRQHLMPIAARFDDPVGVADLFLGTPYLWGGSSRWGLDCSGLVQLALAACGTDCPRDSDQQAEALGEDIDAHEPLKRGDLVFLEGPLRPDGGCEDAAARQRASHVPSPMSR